MCLTTGLQTFLSSKHLGNLKSTGEGSWCRPLKHKRQFSSCLSAQPSALLAAFRVTDVKYAQAWDQMQVTGCLGSGNSSSGQNWCGRVSSASDSTCLGMHHSWALWSPGGFKNTDPWAPAHPTPVTSSPDGPLGICMF